jgi:hypothetical protein
VLFLASVIWALDLQISFGRLQRKYRLPCYSLLIGLDIARAARAYANSRKVRERIGGISRTSRKHERPILIT